MNEERMEYIRKQFSEDSCTFLPKDKYEEGADTPMCDEEFCFLSIIYRTNKACKYCPKKSVKWKKVNYDIGYNDGYSEAYYCFHKIIDGLLKEYEK